MKNTTSIILALSAAFCSLSAQEKQTAKDTTAMLRDTAASIKPQPQKIDLTLPLWEPQNKYLSLGFSGGLSTLKYDPKDCDRSPMAGGSINIDYNVFFGKKWGLSFGVGASVYNAKTIIDTRFL